MTAIEGSFEPLMGMLPKDYGVEEGEADTNKRVVFYGQEKNPDTIRIAKM